MLLRFKNIKLYKFWDLHVITKKKAKLVFYFFCITVIVSQVVESLQLSEPQISVLGGEKNHDLFGHEHLLIQVRVLEFGHLSSPLRVEQLRGPPNHIFFACWRSLCCGKRQECETDHPFLRQVPLMVWRSRLPTVCWCIPLQLSLTYVNHPKTLVANEGYHIRVKEMPASLEGSVGEYAGGRQVTALGRCGVCWSMRRHSTASVYC
jgi:hypothetical protein